MNVCWKFSSFSLSLSLSIKWVTGRIKWNFINTHILYIYIYIWSLAPRRHLMICSPFPLRLWACPSTGWIKTWAVSIFGISSFNNYWVCIKEPEDVLLSPFEVCPYAWWCKYQQSLLTWDLLPSKILHVWFRSMAIHDCYLLGIYIKSTPFFSHTRTGLELAFDHSSDLSLQNKFLAMAPCFYKIFSLVVTKMWPGEFLMYPRSQSLTLNHVFLLYHLPVHPGSSWNLSVTWRKNPVLPLSAHPFWFLLLTPLWHPLPPILTCGRSGVLAFGIVP